MAYGFSRNHRLYLQKESSFGTIPNSSGTATLAGANACRHTAFNLIPGPGLLRRNDKTGSRTQTQGVAGRKTATWNGKMDLAANGAAGVVPDCDPILAALFGADGVVVASTSVTYSLTDVVKSFTGWGFRTPAALMQQVGAGCLVNRATFRLGEDVATWDASGSALWVLDSANFSTTDATGKAGLTAYPTEPVTPVTNGGIVAGFTGQATLDGNVLANIDSATLDIVTGNAMAPAFGSYYSTIVEAIERSVGLSFSLFDDDAAGTTNLYTKAVSKTPINATLQIGTVTGNKWTFTVKGIQLEVPNLDDSRPRWIARFGNSPASGSSITALDEVSLVIT